MEKRITINWDTIYNVLNFESYYDAKLDVLYAHSKDNRPAVSIDCDGEFWIRVDSNTGEIFGIEIEDFKKIFLKKHPLAKKSEDAYIKPITELIHLEKCPA
jgi:uncharacterized protein YuzE